MAPQPTRKQLSLFIVIAAAAALGGAYAGASLSIGSALGPAQDGVAASPANGSETRARELRSIAERLDAVERSIDALTTSMERTHRRSASPGTLDDANDGNVESRLAELALEVERLRREVAALAAGGGARPALQIEAGAPAESVPDPLMEDFRERVRGLKLLTYQQVLDRFGRPVDISPNTFGGTSWAYPAGSGKTLLLEFSDGLLASYQVFDG